VAEAERQHLLELLSELRKVDAWVARPGETGRRIVDRNPGIANIGDVSY